MPKPRAFLVRLEREAEVDMEPSNNHAPEWSLSPTPSRKHRLTEG